MPQTLHIICPNLRCKRVLAVPATARGKMVRCKSCGTNVKVPMPKTDAPPPPIVPEPEKATDA